MARLVLGPMLRYVDDTNATIWMETDAPCTVEVLGRHARTFTVHGHHYALVAVTGLPPGTARPYSVALDGERVWPEPGGRYPPSRVRTVDPAAQVRLVFGSCRTSVPHDATSTLRHGVDMLRSYACALRGSDEAEWPTALLLLGDQVYADQPPEPVREFIRGRRDPNDPPGEEVADFAEYAELYRVAWSDPDVRWLLSTVPTAMIVDDHDLRDDWNTSQAWRDRLDQLPWWRRRLTAGLGAYWIYQHLGNLAPDELAREPQLAALRGQDRDGGALLDEFALRAYREPSAYRWSYARDIGPSTRLVMLDVRCGRVLTNNQRHVIDRADWAWLREVTSVHRPHLVIGSSLPYLLPTGVHYLERWNEAVCDGAWGRPAARIGERVRQGLDLEHWAAFGRSFDAMARLVMDLTNGRRAWPPTSIGFLSGDVHFSYLALTRGRHTASTVYQLVCSPIRNPLPMPIRLLNGAASFGAAGLAGRALARLAGVRRAPLSWRIERGPFFHNALGVLDLGPDGVEACWTTAETNTRLTTEPTTEPTIEGPPPLQLLARHRLA